MTTPVHPGAEAPVSAAVPDIEAVERLVDQVD